MKCIRCGNPIRWYHKRVNGYHLICAKIIWNNRNQLKKQIKEAK